MLLDQKKRMASDNEDYDGAKVLKNEMDKIKAAATN